MYALMELIVCPWVGIQICCRVLFDAQSWHKTGHEVNFLKMCMPITFVDAHAYG